MVQQECIPIGCIPPVAVAVCWAGGVCLIVPHCMLGYTPPQVWAWRPPGQTPQPPPWLWAWRAPAPLWTELLTHASEILPCPNFVADSNKQQL